MLPVPSPDNPHALNTIVYLFGTKKSVEIHITSKDRVVDIIRHLITILKLEQKEPMAFELRLIDDDEDYYVPFYEISALEYTDPVGEFNSLALVNNKSYSPPKAATQADIAALGSSSNSSESMYYIHIKLPFLEMNGNIEVKNKNTTLLDLLKAINEKYNLSISESAYTFKIKSENSYDNNTNIDDVIYNLSILDYRLQVRNLPTRNLELISKVYKDSATKNNEYSEEEKISWSMKLSSFSTFSRDSELFTMQKSPNPLLAQSPPLVTKKSAPIDMNKDVKDFQFNDLTAKKLQEFEIIKINYRGKRQKRILGVDGFAIYNDKVPNREKSKRFAFIKKMFKSSEVKKSSRPLNTIKEVERTSDKIFKIIFLDEKKNKTITYECTTSDQCSEILAKIEYLLNGIRKQEA